ncbi:MAG TPA: hypothetical protein DCS07_16395 [Bdellovibrionales bacterium]|nr:MAG: hypothetical protein A2070_01050 [Bdellovibrionales bacterium GWC1_52_8]HAR44185.1 hypothetical protein [Bdellovibrionales bacterium]
MSVIGLTLLSGCQGNERLVEKAGLEGAVAAEKQVDAENVNLKRRSSELELDLSRRQRFFQAVAGTYEGSLQTDQGAFNMRVTLVSTIPPFASDRTRMPEEIVSDLNNLSISTQIVQWHPSNSMSATGCRAMGIRPNLTEGELTVASSECPNFYTVKISDEPGAGKDEADPENRESLKRKWSQEASQSEKIAHAILEGKGGVVQHLIGQMKPTTNAEVYYFMLKRVE